MTRIEAFQSNSISAGAGHVPVACFGERGMHRGSDCPGAAPLAAGLFGVASGCAAEPVPSQNAYTLHLIRSGRVS